MCIRDRLSPVPQPPSHGCSAGGVEAFLDFPEPAAWPETRALAESHDVLWEERGSTSSRTATSTRFQQGGRA
eukprot:3968581-Alexandrium_andersonii.AAC.1